MRIIYKKPSITSSNMRGYKIKLYPSESQKEILNEHINLFRYAYNWALNESIEFYKENKSYIGKTELMKRFSIMRNNNEWMQKLPLHSGRLAIEHLDFAYKKFFKGLAHFPVYKSKKYSKKCVHYRNESYAFNFTEDSVRISGFARNERILCKTHNIPPSKSGYYNCTITFDGINYWLSVNVENVDINPDYYTDKLTDESIGIDLGIRKFAQLSNGMAYHHPKKLKVLDKRQRKEQSRLIKMRNTRLDIANKAKIKLEDVPLTKNEQKLKIKNMKTKLKQKNIRNSFIHQTTTEIVKLLPERIVIEDLNVSEFKRQKINNRDAIAHSMWYKFRECLSYKCYERNINLVVADRSFPLSQLCSRCGFRKKTSYREFICPNCGLRIDRDLNASINLSMYNA